MSEANSSVPKSLRKFIDATAMNAEDRKLAFLEEFQKNRSFTKTAAITNIPYGTLNTWMNEDEVFAERIDLIKKEWFDSVSDVAEDRLSLAIKNDKTGWISMEWLKIHRARDYAKSELYNKPVSINVQINANMDNHMDTGVILDNAENSVNIAITDKQRASYAAPGGGEMGNEGD